MQEIQKKFADDPVRQNEEIQKLYAETKFNPWLAACPCSSDADLLGHVLNAA